MPFSEKAGLTGVIPGVDTPLALKGKPEVEEREEMLGCRAIPGVEAARCRAEREWEEAVRAAEALDSMMEKQ